MPRSTLATAAVVAGRIVKDWISPHKVTEAREVPATVSALTPAWWTAVLGSAHPNARVVRVDQVGGTSGTHARNRFEITWNEAGAGLPKAVFTKTLPTLMNRMIGGFNGTAKAEGRFYTEIRANINIEAPVGYHAGFDGEALAAINVLEDIGVTRNASFLDAETKISREMAKGIVELLADLHGATWNDPRLDNEWKWVVNFADWYAGGAQKMKTEKYTYQALNKARDLLPENLCTAGHDLWRATDASAEIHRRANPRCVLHSDVHPGNWYRAGSGAMGLLDWQCLTQGHFARDLAYAISAALEPEERRAWERDLVSRYLARLSEHVGDAPMFDDAWTVYRTQMLHAFWMWTITLCHSPLLPAMQTESTSFEMVRRIGIAVDDHQSIDLALGRIDAC